MQLPTLPMQAVQRLRNRCTALQPEPSSPTAQPAPVRRTHCLRCAVAMLLSSWQGVERRQSTLVPCNTSRSCSPFMVEPVNVSSDPHSCPLQAMHEALKWVLMLEDTVGVTTHGADGLLPLAGRASVSGRHCRRIGRGRLDAPDGAQHQGARRYL